MRHSYTAELNGEIIGFASGVTNHKWFMLSDMWVKPGHRRKGIGTRLLGLLEEKIRNAGMKHVYTWMITCGNVNDYVWTIGHGNEHFYATQGYSAYTVIENMFGTEGIHHVGYSKDLLLAPSNPSFCDSAEDMRFVDREITRDEHKQICAQIEVEARKFFPPRKQKKYSYVFEDNGDVVGYAAGFTNYAWLVLTDMWVKQEYRRQGLGSKLLLFLEEAARADGIKHVYTWTYGQHNARFYEGLGYKCFTVLEDFFEVSGIHHIGYTKDLQG